MSVRRAPWVTLQSFVLIDPEMRSCIRRNRQTEIRTDRERDRQTDRQTDRQADIQTYSKRQTNRQTDRETDRQTYTLIYILDNTSLMIELRITTLHVDLVDVGI